MGKREANTKASIAPACYCICRNFNLPQLLRPASIAGSRRGFVVELLNLESRRAMGT